MAAMIKKIKKKMVKFIDGYILLSSLQNENSDQENTFHFQF